MLAVNTISGALAVAGQEIVVKMCEVEDLKHRIDSGTGPGPAGHRQEGRPSGADLRSGAHRLGREPVGSRSRITVGAMRWSLHQQTMRGGGRSSDHRAFRQASRGGHFGRARISSMPISCTRRQNVSATLAHSSFPGRIFAIALAAFLMPPMRWSKCR